MQKSISWIGIPILCNIPIKITWKFLIFMQLELIEYFILIWVLFEIPILCFQRNNFQCRRLTSLLLIGIKIGMNENSDTHYRVPFPKFPINDVQIKIFDLLIKSFQFFWGSLAVFIDNISVPWRNTIWYEFSLGLLTLRDML